MMDSSGSFEKAEDFESRIQLLEAESKLKRAGINSDDSVVIRIERQIRDLNDEFQQALHEIRNTEKAIKHDLADKMQLLEQQVQVGAWNTQRHQTDEVKNLRTKVDTYEQEFNTIYKRINELTAYSNLMP